MLQKAHEWVFFLPHVIMFLNEHQKLTLELTCILWTIPLKLTSGLMLVSFFTHQNGGWSSHSQQVDIGRREEGKREFESDERKGDWGGEGGGAFSRSEIDVFILNLCKSEGIERHSNAFRANEFYPVVNSMRHCTYSWVSCSGDSSRSTQASLVLLPISCKISQI